MAMRPGPPRQPVGSMAWCAEERSSALQISQSEVEEFGYSARNELDWLNEHMADVFSENQINVVDVFKTPGKLRGKTPRTARKPIQNENRVPLSNIFSATPQGEPNPFTTSALHNDRTPKFRIAEDNPASPAMRPSVTRKPVPTKPAIQEPVTVADSGYYGSQSQDATFQIDELAGNVEPVPPRSPQRTPGQPRQPLTALAESNAIDAPGPTTEVFEDPVESVEAAETNRSRAASPEAPVNQEVEAEPIPVSSPVNLLGPESPEKSPVEASPSRPSPNRPEPPAAHEGAEEHLDEAVPEAAFGSTAGDDEVADVTGSPSDGSSPIRPLVRKSSLNFASLPAREPMASNKSLGARVSRISHIDQARTSFYPRITGGKSLGIRQETRGDDHEPMDIDEDEIAGASSKGSTLAAHSKTYTQRLQDQISMLGKSQTGGSRLSKSIPSLVGTQKAVPNNQSQIPQTTRTDTEMEQTPPRKQQVAKTPGAFPDDDDDDWIAPPTTTQGAAQSPRPAMEKSYTADVMEGLHGKNTVGGGEFVLPQHPSQSDASDSPPNPPASKPELAPVVGHVKSVSVDLSNHNPPPQVSDSSLRKIVSASNPVSVTTQDNDVDEPPKSPSRTFRESPLKHSALKQVKNKFSSILKNSKGLLASSAAISAEGKASLVNSPSTVRLEKQPTKSTDSLRSGNEPEPLYPDLTRHASWDSQPAPTASSPSRSNGRRTRASAERDRREQKQKGREDKEAAHIASQMDKLEKEREKEREKARVFSKEQERIAAAEKQLAAQKERERAMRTPAPKEVPRATRTSPRKAKTQQDPDSRAAADMAEPGFAEQDIEMTDAPASKPAPASIPRPTPGSSLKREIKRPAKPTREPVTKPKQAPTLIRVNTSSQNTGFHPSNSVLAATLESTLGPSQQQIKGKTSQPMLQNKTSQQSFNSSVNSTTGRPKALDLAAKRKQQEEKEAQRRRDAKAEIDRKRAAMREEDRRQEQERREKERQQAAKEEEAKKKAQRQAAIEKAKQTRAPPPAVRSQPNAAPEYNSVRDKAGIPRPSSRLHQSTAHRSQEDVSRPVNAVLSSTTSMSLKRPLQHDGAEERPTAPRSGPSQPKEVKRMRMSDEFSLEDEAEIQSYGTSLKGPPVRPSAGFKKDLPNKSLYSGYAPAPQGATRDIFKAPVAPQQHNKAGHPLDMAQVSKGPIPFAASHHAAGSSHKTPARPKSVVATKSAAKPRSSPRLQNGENIELPEIQTDDDDDDEEEDEGAKALAVASWADTPALRRELMRQETVDPLQVFGPPAPLNMEEVFSKSKDRWHKFRARTSSANWSGADRLTEEEIRRDLAARDRMRREGGWTYELSKDM